MVPPPVTLLCLGIDFVTCLTQAGLGMHAILHALCNAIAAAFSHVLVRAEACHVCTAVNHRVPYEM